MSNEKLFTVAGITLHARDGESVNKVRFGNDYVRLIKMLSSNRKVGVSRDVGGRGDGFLDAKRVDLVVLPGAMTKIDATKYLLTHPDFQSPADQALLNEALSSRETKSSRGEKVVKVAKPSLEAIKARGAKATTTVDDVLNAVE